MRGQNKYNARRTTYGGRIYDSKREADEALLLDLLVYKKEIKSWCPQWKISIDVNGEHICNHFIDFKIIHNDDSIELREVKGRATAVWRLKLKLLKATYLKDNPQVKYTVVQ